MGWEECLEKLKEEPAKEAMTAVDGGAQQRIIVAAEPRTNMVQPISAPLVEGEWIVVDANLHEDEWTKI